MEEKAPVAIKMKGEGENGRMSPDAKLAHIECARQARKERLL
jgi:hypothetical protein